MATSAVQEDFLFTVQLYISSNDFENIINERSNCSGVSALSCIALRHEGKDSIAINIQYPPQNYIRNYTKPIDCNSLFPFLGRYHFKHTHTHTHTHI